MKKTFQYILIGLLGAASSSCDFQEVNTDQEATNEVTSAMIATRIILHIANQPREKAFLQPYMLNKNIVWTEFQEAYQYNGFGRGSLNFSAINDAHFMPKFAGTEKLAKSYEGLMYFARAVKFFEATMDLGDIPYNDALKGETEKLYFPKYDLQKDVFLGILNELELADQAFAAGDTFAGDPVYKGDVDKWRKLANSYALHVLIQLSKKESDTDLDVKNRFQQILANKPIFASNADNYQLIRSDQRGQQYPFYKVDNQFTIYPTMTTEVIDRLKARSDRRLFYYGNPSPVKIAGGASESDFAAYVGIDPSLPYDDVTAQKTSGDWSGLNDRYVEIAEGEPTQQLSYAQICLSIAEAAARGWISESAVDWYKNGVRASMEFIYDKTPNTAQYHHGMPLDAAYVTAHVDALGTAFPAAAEAQIEEIIEQKYLASFLQSEFTTYYDYRRTGYPKWTINPTTNLNSEATDRMPVRWRYPTSEFEYNTANVDEAVARQFGGTDGINEVMWLLK